MIKLLMKKQMVLAALVGCTVMAGAAGAAETIKVGVAGSMTGGYAAFGAQYWRGASQAAADINAAGGINGKKIELVKADDACDPKQAVNVANHLVDVDKVAAVIGHYCSSSAIPAADIYGNANVPMMTPSATNPKVTDRHNPMIFRMCGRDDQQGIVAADFIVKNLKAKRIAVVHDKDAYGLGITAALKDQLHKLKAKEVLYEGLTRGEKDFNALVTKIRSVKADAVFFGGNHAEAGILVRQMREQGLTASFISDDAINSPEFVTAAGGGKFVDGVYMSFGPDPLNLPGGREVVKKFRASGYEPEGYTLYSYATLQAFAAAMKATKTTDGKKLADWLHRNSVQTVMGTKNWDAKGDLNTAGFVVYRWSADGKYKQVK
ncbi:MAG: branched-chain amino acid ABC transporter substrate-binding protein [Desulfuromonadaceae bacterium]